MSRQSFEETPFPSRTEQGDGGISIQELPPETLCLMFRFLPWETVVAMRLESKFWYAACCAYRPTTMPLKSTLIQVQTWTKHGLWAHLLSAAVNETSKSPAPSIQQILQKYLVALIPHANEKNLVEKIAGAYSAQNQQWFDPQSPLFHETIVQRHKVGFPKPPEEVQRLQPLARGHVDHLLNKWREQLIPDSLLETAQQLLLKAYTLRTGHPLTVKWLLKADTLNGLIEEAPEGRSEPSDHAIDAFLKAVATFEEVLLEFTTFLLMMENSPTPETLHQEQFVFRKTFPLPTCLSKSFYKNYMGYGDKAYHYRDRALVLRNPVLVDYLCDNDDALLLSYFKGLWNELPGILRANPNLYTRMYTRMRPELWTKLCQKEGNYVRFILQDPNIYQASFTSAELFRFLQKFGSQFRTLCEEKIKLTITFLKRLNLEDLCRLRSEFNWDQETPRVMLVHQVLCEKLTTLSEEATNFQSLDDTVLKTLHTYFSEYPDDTGSAKGNAIVNAEIERRDAERRRKDSVKKQREQQKMPVVPVPLPSNARPFKPLRLQQSRRLKASISRTAITTPASVLRQKQSSTKVEVIRQPPLAVQQLVQPLQQPRPASRSQPSTVVPQPLRRQRIAPQPQNQRSLRSLLARFYAKWKAIPLFWKLLIIAILIAAVAGIVAAAVAMPPSLVVSLPLVGTVSVSTIVIVAIGLGATLSLIGHATHTLFTKVPPRHTEPVRPRRSTTPRSHLGSRHAGSTGDAPAPRSTHPQTRPHVVTTNTSPSPVQPTSPLPQQAQRVSASGGGLFARRSNPEEQTATAPTEKVKKAVAPSDTTEVTEVTEVQGAFLIGS